MRCGRRGTVRHVAGLLRHSPRAAVSPARGGIGSFEAAGRADLGVLGFQSPPGMRPTASSALPQQDPPHRPAGDAHDTGEQLRLAVEAAAYFVVHPGEDLADRHSGSA